LENEALPGYFLVIRSILYFPFEIWGPEPEVRAPWLTLKEHIFYYWLEDEALLRRLIVIRHKLYSFFEL